MKKAMTMVAALLAVAALATSCATLLGGGTTQKVAFATDQPKAHFLVKDQNANVVFDGTDPGTLVLQRKYTYTVEITLDGYAKQIVPIKQGINGWFWGNICIGGILGGVIDAVDGAMWSLTPDKVDVKLKTAMAKTVDGYVVEFLTRDDNGQPRSLDVVLPKI